MKQLGHVYAGDAICSAADNSFSLQWSEHQVNDCNVAGSMLV